MPQALASSHTAPVDDLTPEDASDNLLDSGDHTAEDFDIPTADEVLSFDVAHAPPPLPMAAALLKIKTETGAAPFEILKDFAQLAYGPGKLTFTDYVKYRLFDPAFIKGADKKAFVGQRQNRELLVRLNHRHDWYGLLSNKVASASYLAAYGLPVIAMKAIYAPSFQGACGHLLRSRAELRAYLLTPGNYPLFGKPVEGFQSLGSMALSGCDADAGLLIDTAGKSRPVDTLIDDLDRHYADGYVFQDLLSPDKALAGSIGSALATVRVVTIKTEEGPRIFKAAWKIPANGNVADNYWREGNLLAGLDLANGKIEQVTSGTGFEAKDITHHPDTGADLIGLAVPEWERVKRLALDGARLLQHFGMIGWDIASTNMGPVIVEANETPDLMLIQLAERRGALDSTLNALIDYQKRDAADYMARMKADISKL